MNETKKLRHRFDFGTLSKDLRVVNVSVDWDGEPLILLEEGKPAAPPMDSADRWAFPNWVNTPPLAHVVVHWQRDLPALVRLENSSKRTMTYHVQRFGKGWLLGDSRGGYTRILDEDGEIIRVLDLGDASEHIQTTSDGHIWVAYFDEGVFGNGIGQEGLICFDPNGQPIFRYGDFAEKHKLPSVADCYTLNVDEGCVWACYYTDFPLIQLKDFSVERIWNNFGATKAIAVRGTQFVRFPAYWKPFLLSRSFETDKEDTWELENPEGKPLSKLEGTEADIVAGYRRVPFQVTARGSRLYVWDEMGLYELE